MYLSDKVLTVLLCQAVEKLKKYRCEEMKSGPNSSSDIQIEYMHYKRFIKDDFDFGDSELL